MIKVITIFIVLGYACYCIQARKELRYFLSGFQAFCRPMWMCTHCIYTQTRLVVIAFPSTSKIYPRFPFNVKIGFFRCSFYSVITV